MLHDVEAFEANLRSAGQDAVNDMMGEDANDTCAHVETTMLAVLAAHGVSGNVMATARDKNVYHVEVTELAWLDS